MAWIDSFDQAGFPAGRRRGRANGMASYASRVKGDIGRWVETGLIDAATAEKLERDIALHDRKSLSFGTILAMMAALLFGAAILLFVAANWEAIPRLVRVGALFAVIAAGYIGGAVLKQHDQTVVGEALWLIAASAFGGALAAIGQMYHLPGDEAGAVLVWCIGTIVAAAALRSGPLTIAATGLAVAWLVMRGFEFWDATDFPHLYMALAAILWAVSLWTGSQKARHLILLSLIGYAALFAASHEALPVAILLALVSAVLFAVAVYLPRQVESLLRLGGRFSAHCLIGFLIGIVIAQFELTDAVGPFAFAAAIAFAGIAAAIVLAGRESRGLRWIAYLGFAFELCFVYAVTMGTMLGTAGFFLAAGVILGLLAFTVIRIEKRMRDTQAVEGAAA